MLPIDPSENSRRMIQTGEYQTDKYKVQEDIWLCKYLKQQKYTREEIFGIWQPFFLKRCVFETNPEIMSRSFARIMKCANFDRTKPKKEIILTQADIDKINGLFCVKWMRQYALITLMCSRTLGSELISGYDTDIIPKIYTARQGVRQIDSIHHKLTDLGYIEEVILEERWDESPIVNELGLIVGYEKDSIEKIVKMRVIPYELDKKSPVVFRSKTILDYDKALPLITGLYKCEQCGAEFEMKAKTKRRVCENCWKSLEKKRVWTAVKKTRQSKLTGNGGIC